MGKLVPFVGPAFLVAVGFMDPGNWATLIEGGSRFGYELLWVVVLSNLIAILLQTLSARLAVISGKHFAQVRLYPSHKYPFLFSVIHRPRCQSNLHAMQSTSNCADCSVREPKASV